MSIIQKGGDFTRAELKARKRKLENAIPDLPGDDNTVILQDDVCYNAIFKSSTGRTNKLCEITTVRPVTMYISCTCMSQRAA